MLVQWVQLDRTLQNCTRATPVSQFSPIVQWHPQIEVVCLQEEKRGLEPSWKHGSFLKNQEPCLEKGLKNCSSFSNPGFCLTLPLQLKHPDTRLNEALGLVFGTKSRTKNHVSFFLTMSKPSFHMPFIPLCQAWGKTPDKRNVLALPKGSGNLTSKLTSVLASKSTGKPEISTGGELSLD